MKYSKESVAMDMAKKRRQKMMDIMLRSQSELQEDGEFLEITPGPEDGYDEGAMARGLSGGKAVPKRDESAESVMEKSEEDPLRMEGGPLSNAAIEALEEKKRKRNRGIL